MRRGRPAEKPVFTPKPGRDEIRIVALGGVSEIGKNMYVIEHNDVMIILECGTMIGESTTPGVYSVMPNIQYLKSRKHATRAMVVTDASMKHTGAIANVVRELGPMPIYTRRLTQAVVENRLRQSRRVPSITFRAIESEESADVGGVTLRFFGISDRSPSTLGVVIETKSGSVAYLGSLCPDHTDGVISDGEERRFALLRESAPVVALGDSVNAERPGFSLTDDAVAGEVVDMIKEAPGRSLVPLVHSQVKRNCVILEGAIRCGQDVYIEDSLLLDNLTAARDLGVTDLPKESLRPLHDLDEKADPKTTALFFSGGENEDYPSLERISNGLNRRIRIERGDSVIFPSPIIAANARAVQDMKDRLSRLGASILSYNTSDARGSRHPSKDELLWLHQRSNATFFVPVQGYHYMLTAHTHILRGIGAAKTSCIIPDNGSLIDISPDGSSMKLQKQKAPSAAVSDDGHTPSLVQEVVIQDRQTLSQEGVFIIIVFIDPRRLTLKKSPDIISRGFVYLRESENLVSRARIIIKKVAEQETKKAGRVDIDTVKKAIQKKMQSFLLGETNKRPIVIPVIFL